VPSRFTVTEICVSLVLRSTDAVLISSVTVVEIANMRARIIKSAAC